MKTCAVCKRNKSYADFYNYKSSKDGKSYRCKKCDDEARAKWRENNPNKAKESAKYRNIKAKYGLDRKQYNDLKNGQKGLCKICKRDLKLVVDHCHNSNTVRGLLCNSCNRGIGYLGDDPNRCYQAYKYLTENH